MLFLSTAQDYFLWHYSRAFGEIFKVWMNLLWFTVHFFSMPQLARTLFSPFKRITERKQKGWNFEEFVGYVVINLISRLVGAILRITLLLIGFACLVVVVFGGMLTYVLWLFLPAIIIGLLVSGISLLII